MRNEFSRRDFFKASGFGILSAYIAACESKVSPSPSPIPSKNFETPSPVPTETSSLPPNCPDTEFQTNPPEIPLDDQTRINAIRNAQDQALLNGDVTFPLPEDLLNGKMISWEIPSVELKFNFLAFSGKPDGTTINFPAILDGDVFELLNEFGHTNSFGINRENFILFIKTPSYSISAVTGKKAVKLGDPLFTITYDSSNNLQDDFVGEQVGNSRDDCGNDTLSAIVAIALLDIPSRKWLNLTHDNIIKDDTGQIVSIPYLDNIKSQPVSIARL